MPNVPPNRVKNCILIGNYHLVFDFNDSFFDLEQRSRIIDTDLSYPISGSSKFRLLTVNQTRQRKL
jgi:hypothetical protein